MIGFGLVIGCCIFFLVAVFAVMSGIWDAHRERVAMRERIRPRETSSLICGWTRLASFLLMLWLGWMAAQELWGNLF